MIKGVLFDFDGVIVDSEPLHCKSFQDLLQPLGITFTKERWYSEFAGTGSPNILKKLFRENNVSDDLAPWLKKRKGLFLKYAMEGDLQLIKGIVPFLQRLKSKGIKTAVSSSGNKDYIKRLVDHFQISKYFDIIVSAEDITNNKPNPEIFLTSAKKLNLKAIECVVFEDSVSGVAAAKAANMKVICIKSPAKVDCETKITDFTKSLSLLSLF